MIDLPAELTNDFTFFKEIRSDSLAKNYVLVDNISQIPVVLRIFNKELFRDETQQEKFKKHIQAVMNFDLPFIIKYYKLIETEKYIYLLREYYQNETISSHIISEGRFDPLKIPIYITKLAQIITSLHEHGIFDISLHPSNILISQMDTPILVDLYPISSELCMNLDDVSKWRLSFCSPEIFTGEPGPDGACDKWSLPVIYYFLAQSIVPFSVSNIMALSKEVTSKPIASYRNTHNEIINDIMEKCLKNDPNERAQLSVFINGEFSELVKKSIATSRPPPLPQYKSKSLSLGKGNVNTRSETTTCKPFHTRLSLNITRQRFEY